MGIVKGSSNRKAAERFIDFMLGEQAQKALAIGNIMMPANASVTLPESFEMAMRPENFFALETLTNIGEGSDKLIRRWLEIFGM